MAKRFHSTPSAAEYTGISASALEKRRVYGGGPVYLKVGRLVKYREDDLDRWMQRSPRTSTSDAGAADEGPR